MPRVVIECLRLERSDAELGRASGSLSLKPAAIGADASELPAGFEPAP